jgi:phage-related protein
METIFFNERVKKFFESFGEPLGSRIDRTFHLLKQHGNNLEMPYSRVLGKGLFELRIVGTIHIRFIYAFHENEIFILHGFIKKTNKIPTREINYAQKQLKMLLQ